MYHEPLHHCFRKPEQCAAFCVAVHAFGMMGSCSEASVGPQEIRRQIETWNGVVAIEICT
jgi:hypothetical protein